MSFDSIRELLSRDTKSKPTKRQKDLAQGLIGNLGPRRTWAVYIPFLEIESFDPIHDICRVLLDQISFSGDILCLMKDKICFQSYAIKVAGTHLPRGFLCLPVTQVYS